VGALVGVVPYLHLSIGALPFTYLSSSAAIGMLGNGLFLRRIRIAVAHVRSQELNSGRRLHLLAEEGGTSWFALVYVVLLFLVVRLSLHNWIQP
jgi:hypothetical protein